MKKKVFNTTIKLGLLGAAVALVGCSNSIKCRGNCSGAYGQSMEPQVVVKEVVVEVERDYTRRVPGAVEYVWEEPMVNVVDVPPGLDPEGHYYRPAHEEVVEIRQGRWKYYKPTNPIGGGK